MDWIKTQDYLPKLEIETDWGIRSRIVIGDYGKKEEDEDRYVVIFYEHFTADGLDEYEWVVVYEPIVPPLRWCYIKE